MSIINLSWFSNIFFRSSAECPGGADQQTYPNITRRVTKNLGGNENRCGHVLRRNTSKNQIVLIRFDKYRQLA